jgi:hypothetical protein
MIASNGTMDFIAADKSALLRSNEHGFASNLAHVAQSLPDEEFMVNSSSQATSTHVALEFHAGSL